jgi:hypothetical protein
LAETLIGLEESGEGIKISTALAEIMENITDYVGIQVRQIYEYNEPQLLFTVILSNSLSSS